MIQNSRSTVWWWGNFMFLGFLALFVAMCLTLASCAGAAQAVGDSNSKLAENAVPTFWGGVFGLLAFVLTGGADLIAGAVAAIVGGIGALFSHSPKVVTGAVGSLVPWYLDPMAYLSLALNWLIVAVVIGLAWPRSRQQTIAALGDLFSIPPHPILALRRFLAGLGFLHSDPVPGKDE